MGRGGRRDGERAGSVVGSGGGKLRGGSSIPASSGEGGAARPPCSHRRSLPPAAHLQSSSIPPSTTGRPTAHAHRNPPQHPCGSASWRRPSKPPPILSCCFRLERELLKDDMRHQKFALYHRCLHVVGIS